MAVTVGAHPNAMALSKDGQRLFVPCANTNKAVIDTATMTRACESACRRFPRRPPARPLAVSPDGGPAVANADNTVAMIDIEQPGAARSRVIRPLDLPRRAVRRTAAAVRAQRGS
jgi:DNA-binding beta-propeller fold protein YncE